MQIDPAAEWVRLTKVYGEMGDIELRDLDAGRGDLTEIAQQVLRDELRKRGFKPLPDHADAPATAHWRIGIPGMPELVRDNSSAEAGDELNSDPHDGLPHEFTWKTLLCGCLDGQQAAALSEALRQAGIQSWVTTPYSAFDVQYPRVYVAVDQLDLARAIADRPIPQAIASEVESESPEFVLPRCPDCGAEDPVLESADTANQWLCEACGAQWSDPVVDPGESPGAR